MMEDTFDIRNNRELQETEREFENALRPLSFSSFSGQDKVVENLKIFVSAARMRGESLDHVLLHGPPGLGKTTLSNIIANELGVGFKVTSGPVLDKPGDLAGILTSLEPNDVLFIDEIHRLSPVVEEYLYSAMEDYRIDILIDKGPSARSIQIELNPFTLVGATTRSGLLTSPLRARFGINLHLEYYDAETLTGIVLRSADILQITCANDAATLNIRKTKANESEKRFQLFFHHIVIILTIGIVSKLRHVGGQFPVRIIIQRNRNDGLGTFNQQNRIEAFFDMAFQITHTGMTFLRKPLHIMLLLPRITGSTNTASIETQRQGIRLYFFRKTHKVLLIEFKNRYKFHNIKKVAYFCR
jgi:hypothetical protein